MDVRAAEAVEIDQLARIWYEGWHDAHAQIVPPELARLRSLVSFRPRLEPALLDRWILHRKGRRALSAFRLGKVPWFGRRGGPACRRGGSAGRERRRNCLARMRDRKPP